MALIVLKDTLLILWLMAAAYYLLSALSVRAVLGEAKRGPVAIPPQGLPPVTILKPVRGVEEGLYENLESFIKQDYPACQVVFGVMDEDDPALRVIERLKKDNPGRDIAVAVSGRRIGPNLKACNLLNMYPLARHDILIISDSDMRVGPDYAASMSRDFEDGSVGLATCLYRGVEPKDIGAAMEALTIDTDFLPSVAVAVRLEGLSFALGATMAVRREALEKIGGFAALADYLADDYHLGKMVYDAGYGLRLSRYVVDSVQGHVSFNEYFLHQLRWARTYRVCRPAGYLFYGLTKGTAFAVFFLVLSGFSWLGWLIVLTDITIRQLQALYIERFVKGRGVLRYFWLVPAKDLTSFVIWALSFTGSVVKWKNARFKIGADGKMAPLA